MLTDGPARVGCATLTSPRDRPERAPRPLAGRDSAARFVRSRRADWLLQPRTPPARPSRYGAVPVGADVRQSHVNGIEHGGAIPQRKAIGRQ